MSRIVFFSIPAYGHTNPTLGVVRELVAQGHEVWYYSYEPLRAIIEAAGARFIPCDPYDTGQTWTANDRARIGKDLAFSTKILVDTTLALDAPVCREMEQLKPDCIVADSMAIWGKMIALKLGIPFVSSTTTFAFNRHSAQIMKQSLAERLSMVFALPKLQKQIRRLQGNGYPVRTILDLIGNDPRTDTIVYTSPEFQPASETFPDCYAFVGPSIRSVTVPFRKKQDTLIYVSMGTVNNDLLPLYRSCIAAFRDFPCQVILSVGDLVDPRRLGDLPEHIEVYPRVDQISVLEQADVFITHCGMNSVSESLWFGVPMLLLPQTAEQGGVAVRVEQLGAGLRPESTSAPALRAAVEQVLNTPDYRKHAERLAAGFRRCSGPRGAAEKILSLCKQ